MAPYIYVGTKQVHNKQFVQGDNVCCYQFMQTISTNRKNAVKKGIRGDT